MRSFARKFLAVLFVCSAYTGFCLAQLKSEPLPPATSGPSQQTAEPQQQPQQHERDPAKEEPYLQELQKKAPKAVPVFKTATENLDKQNYQDAISQYNEVLKQAPNFEPALRRLGYCLVATGKRSEGLEMSQKALSLNRSADNLVGQASVLASLYDGSYRATPAEISQALALAKEAFEKDGKTNTDTAIVIAQLSLMANKMDDLDKAALFLKEKAPDAVMTHYFNGIRLANYGAFSSAEAEIRLAETKGLPHDDAQPILLAIAKASDSQQQDPSGYFQLRYLYYGFSVLGVWGLGLVFLFVTGEVLSAKTLRSIENSDPNDITGGGQKTLRRIYRGLITFGGIYYYISQPIVVLLVIAVTLGLAILFLYIGWVPIKLLFIFGIVGVVTIFYMVRSVFIRTKREDPGRALLEEEAPGLWALAREVAETVNTRPVNEIRITPGTDLAVYERGGMRAKMSDQGERILILGMAVIGDFKQNSFRAILAHEYGHFSSRDTAGGTMAMRVNNHIMHLAQAMAMSGTATYYNIAFQFLRLYHFLFRRITHGASRLQEILADRVAAYQYGVEAFRDGLTHVIRREVEFSYMANKEIGLALSGSGHKMQNLYEMSETDENARNNMELKISTILESQTSQDDTHPSPQDRFKLTSQIRSRETAPLEGMVWDLFKDKDGLTKEMNAQVEKAVGAGK